MSPTDKSTLIKKLAEESGFDRVGVTAAGPIPRGDYVREWLDRWRAGTMAYLHRHHDIRTDPRNLLPGARGVIVTALLYNQEAPERPDDGKPRGRVARYAWGEDYHVVVKRRLHTLIECMRQQFDEEFDARACVDTVPILERELAALAGIGWIGKNTVVLHERMGSYFFLGEIVTTLELAGDEPAADHCGTCTRCLEACPTGAFPAPYEMDASRCISYLTIEHRGDIAEEFHTGLGAWIFGCDICQEVCPYNYRAPLTRAFTIREPGPTPVLRTIAEWTEDDYRGMVKNSAMNRASLAMWKRNAGIAAGNAEGRR